MSSETRNHALAVLKALADGTRFDVFRLIAVQDGEICACDIVDRFDVSQPTIAHHLKVLREAGLITVSRRGVWAWYAIDPDGARMLESLPESLFAPVRQLAEVG
jgi:ArsR family transcriptional regulator